MITINQLFTKIENGQDVTLKKEWMIHVERYVMENTKLSCGARVLYAILRGYQGRNCREPFPSLPSLVKQVGRVRKVIQKYLGELENAGLIEKVSRRKSGQFCSNGYRILGRSPQGKNVTTVNVPPQGKNTVGQKHRSEETPQGGNCPTKESQYLRNHILKKRESEESLPSLEDAIAHYTPLFPAIDVKRSLTKFHLKEGRVLSPAAIERWLGREEKAAPKPRTASQAGSEPDPEGWPEWLSEEYPGTEGTSFSKCRKEHPDITRKFEKHRKSHQRSVVAMSHDPEGVGAAQYEGM